MSSSESMGQCNAIPKVTTAGQQPVATSGGHKPVGPSQTEQELQDAQRKRVQMRKRVAVAARAISLDTGVELPSHPKGHKTLNLLERAVDKNLLFSHLSLPAKKAIFDSMAPLHASRGSMIIKEGDPDAKTFYVIETGSCDVLQDNGKGRGNVIQSLGSGSAFGELALLYASPRAASVVASSDCLLWVMERDVYNAIYNSFIRQQVQEKWDLMAKVTALQSLDQNEKALVVNALELREFGDQDTICYKGDPGNTFYLIKEGAVSVKAEDKEIATLEAGEWFGERALLVDEPRNADVVAKGYVVCFTLTRKVFTDLLGSREELWQFGCLRKVPVLCNVSDEQLWQLLKHMETQTFERGDFVFRKGEAGQSFYIVINGTFRIFDDEKVLTEVGPGSCFGELALLSDEKRQAHVMAVESTCEVMKLRREVFNFLLGSLESMSCVWRYEALRKVPLFAPLDNKQLTQIAQAMYEQSFDVGQDIILQGDDGDQFYVIQQGEVMIVNTEGKELSRKGPKDYFGELSLLKNEPRAATVRAVTPTSVLSLNRKQFDDQMAPLKATLAKYSVHYYEKEGTMGKLCTPVSTTDIHPVCILGQGAFGKVILARYLGKLYALKMLWKSHIIKMGVQDHVKREAKILMSCRNDFLVNLYATGKSDEKLYMLMEPVLGGELFTHLRKKKQALTETEAKFYVACVVQALEYLQQSHIAYRDLKPENLLIDKDGYLKMADFGFAKAVRGQTYTLCGTPDYLAPELVLQSGHNYAVDWWALGVLIFELVIGYPPFYDDDKVTMYKNITELRYYLPRKMSKECKDLIKKLLVKNPAQRLGMGKPGATAIKSHSWFQGFDWSALATRTMTAPFVPQLKSEDDTSYFDEVPDVEEPRKRYVSTGVFRDF